MDEKKNMPLEIEKENPRYAVGVDIGGTSTRVALYDEELNLLKRIQFATNTEDPLANTRKIASTIMAFEKPVVGVGVSCPGVLNFEEGYIVTSTNLKEAWIRFPLTKTLEDLCGAPAWLQNDANLAALAEATAGEGKNEKVVQFLTISTGIGAGLVIDKEIYSGAHSFGNEVANCIVWKDGPRQGSLEPGAIEAIASGTAITRRAREAGLEVAHAGEVNHLAVQGNPVAESIMEDAKEYLANHLATLMAISDPSIIILGGSVAMKTPGFVEDVEQRVRKKVFPVLKPYVKIHRSTLQEDSGLIGAASLALLRDSRR